MSSTVTVPVVPFDPEVAAALAKLPLPDFISAEMVEPVRQAGFMGLFFSAESTIADAKAPYGHHEVAVPRADGSELVLSIFTPTAGGAARPCIYYIHGGGMLFGDRFTGAAEALGWAAPSGAVVASVEYRRAPENPDPAPVEDCYSGLAWVAAHAAELGVDPAQILVAGHSAGGGLAAGTVLLTRDRGGPALAGQLLVYPMLDDRMATPAHAQYLAGGLWNHQSDVTGWTALLGARRGGADVSIYAAPGRATDLSGLPPAFIAVGSADVFRDDDVAYAQRLWAHGVQAELHVWPGGCHGYDLVAPSSDLTLACLAARRAWVTRLFKASN